MDAPVKKLKVLKSLVIKWERKKKLAAKEELVKIERDLDTLYTNHPLVLEKGQRKLILLIQEEETWRQKRRLN
jgi:hypothetical protein